jgi:hypothetical protein
MTPHQQAHYQILLTLDGRKLPERAWRIAKIIAQDSILLGRPYAYFPQHHHLATLLDMDRADVTRTLHWLKQPRVGILEEPIAGWYALNSPAQWAAPQRVIDTPAKRQLHVWLQQQSGPQELRDPIRQEVLDKAGVLNQALRQVTFTDVVVSGAAAVPGTQAAIAPASAAAAEAGAFDVGVLLQLCRNDPTSPAAIEYLARFPQVKALYEQGASGGGSPPALSVSPPTPGGVSPPASKLASSASSKSSVLEKAKLAELAWSKLRAIDTAGVLQDRAWTEQWFAIARRNPDKLLAFIQAMENSGWLDKYGRPIHSRLGYLAQPARAEEW